MTEETARPATALPARSGGFSLAEVLIAVSLLGVILLALFGLISAGVRRAYGGKKMTQGTVIAQTVMERANTYAPQDLLGAAGTATTATRTWSRVGATTTPAAESGTSTPVVERNAWRTMLATADLPSTAGNPATLTVTMTPVPSGRTFATATMVRVVVDLTWFDFGTRRRQVRLQTMNLPVTP
ncbi:MAG TPA: prepilin-type N-terminal cleavage/methylation domain-containing protein [Thermoanaerobaculia bacterium]|nr:prepilin-type N-terminal cleavage/methylation domain-containing protein [Thermoanaerobaculia bacterium]